MQKKILLKTTREYLQNSFPENLLPARKIRQKKKKLFLSKTRYLKTQIIKAKKQVFNQYANSVKKNFIFKDKGSFINLPNEAKSVGLGGSNEAKLHTTVSNKNVIFYNPRTFLNNKHFTNSVPFLFSTNQIQYELSRKKTRSSDFKNQLKERKKLALIYGQLSKTYIKKTLKQASKLNGKKHDNFFFLLESRLDVVAFRACFFSSIKAARQWINHNKILVNNQFINTSSYRLKPGDIISIKPKDKLVLSRQIMYFLKKSFFKQNKAVLKQFTISTFVFTKLKKILKPLANTQSLINTFKSINKNLDSSSYPNFTPNYKQFLLQVQQVLRFVLNTDSNKKRHFKNSNSFALRLSPAYKSTLIYNLTELDLLKKRNLKSLEDDNKKALSTGMMNKVHHPVGNKLNLSALRSFLIHLKLKKLFFKSEKKQSFTILNQNILKPLNLEISYKNLVIIYLYPPQKITFNCSIDMELISRSLY